MLWRLCFSIHPLIHWSTVEDETHQEHCNWHAKKCTQCIFMSKLKSSRRQDSLGSWIGFHAVDSGFKVRDSSFCQWNLDPVFQSLVGFRISWAVFRIPKPRIPVSTTKNVPDTGIWIPLHGALTWGDVRVAFIIIKDGEKPKNFYFEAHDCRNYPRLARTAFHWCGKFNKKRSMKQMRKNLSVPRFLLHNLINVKQTHY